MIYPVIAAPTQTQGHKQDISVNDIDIPLILVLGMIFTLGGFIWQAAQQWAEIKNVKKELSELGSEIEAKASCAAEMAKESHAQLKHSFKQELMVAETNISHAFELAILDLKKDFELVRQNLDARDATVNRLRGKVGYLQEELSSLDAQFKKQNIDVHLRGYNGPISTPGNYE